MTTTYCNSSEVAVFSSFWDSLPSIPEDDFTFSKQGHGKQASLSYESLSRVMGIIECAEDIMLSASALFDEVDLEPLPLGGKLDFIKTPNRNGCDDILDSFIHSMKRRSEEEDEQHCAKKQRLSSPACVISFAADSAEQTTEQVSSMPPKNNTGARFRRYQADQWMDRFDDLINFKAEFGTCLVPHSYPPNQQLAQWVKRQRYQHKLKAEGRHSTLTDARKQELDDMGFVWDSHKAAWDERLESLKAFHAKYGSTLVPTNYEADKPLAVWVKCQRRQLKLFRLGKPSTMTEERFQELEKLGFEWNPRNL